ncbi:MAG: hypothetical protein ACRDYA_19735 [Egibacteraceae bacterium]
MRRLRRRTKAGLRRQAPALALRATYRAGARRTYHPVVEPFITGDGKVFAP